MSKRRTSRVTNPPRRVRSTGNRPRGFPSPHTLAVALIGAAAVILAAVVPTVIASGRPSDTSSPGTGTAPAPTRFPAVSPSVPTSSPDPLIPGDNTEFVKDINYPDWSQVEVGAHFIKKWELRNTGSVRWSGRYIVPDGTSMGTCTYPGRVPVPATDPGHVVIISVPVMAASEPQLCMATWKMVNSAGDLYFPGYTGFWFEVKLIKKARK